MDSLLKRVTVTATLYKDDSHVEKKTRSFDVHPELAERALGRAMFDKLEDVWKELEACDHS